VADSVAGMEVAAGGESRFSANVERHQNSEGRGKLMSWKIHRRRDMEWRDVQFRSYWQVMDRLYEVENYFHPSWWRDVWPGCKGARLFVLSRILSRPIRICRVQHKEKEGDNDN